MDTNVLVTWLAVLNPLVAALLILGNDRLKWWSSARRDRRKLRLWTYIYPRLQSATLNEDQILRDCRWLHGEAELQALIYDVLREGTIPTDFLWRIRGDPGGR